MLQTLFALLIFLFPLAYSPGPGNMTFAASGARFGPRATLPANLGYHICAWIITAAIGFGAYQAAQNSPTFFKIVQALGALYVLWLAFRFLMAGASDNSQTAKPMSFWDGVVLMALNPKAYAIIALMFSQFLGDTLGRQFRSPEAARRLNLLFGALLVLVALWMLSL